MTAIVPISAVQPAPGVRPEILSALALEPLAAQHFSSRQSLSIVKEAGLLDQVPSAAARVRAALAPVQHNRLTDRLTALGMMMAPNRAPAEAQIWLREMARLLGDLPEDILAEAIDGLVKTSKFLPTCSEIREVAEPALERRRRAASQLDAMSRYIGSGQVIPYRRKFDPAPASGPVEPCTPEQAAAILAEFPQLSSATRINLMQHLGPRREPTRQDYIDLGVDPATLDATASAWPTG